MTSLSGAAAGERERPRREPLADQVYETIKSSIMDNRVEAGARLNIDALAREFEVSPTPVREALARLASEGLVHQRPLAGYRVEPQLERAGVDQLFTVRRLLEPYAAQAAATLASPAQLKELRQLADGMETSVGGSSYTDYRELVERDALFHDLIAAASGNEVLRRSLTRLHAHLHLFRLHFETSMSWAAAAEHQRIVEALQARDGVAAAAAMDAHLAASRERIFGASDGAAS